jgi:3-oxoacyl-(acyl-carrier-protein) synthase
MKPMFPPLAVTGAGMVTAAGRGVDSAWEALCSGNSRVVLDADPELAGFSPIASARCSPIDPESLGADRRAARIMGRHTHMLLAGVSDAIREAAGKEGGLAGEETAFFAGMDSVDPGGDDLVSAALASLEGDTAVDYAKFFSGGMNQIPPLWPLGMLNAIGFCQVAIQFGLRGDNASFSPGPESAGRAVIEAAESVREGKSKVALAAGVSAVLSARSVARYLNRGFLRPGPAAPEPFSGKDGTALGEGAGIIVLEPLEVARKSGKSLVGILKGWGRGTAAEGVGSLSSAIWDSAAKALEAASLTPSQVDLVVPHGQGIWEEDSAEAEAVSVLFGKRRPRALATKGAFGHLLGGSPLVDLLLALRALREETVPPSPGVGERARDVLDFPDAPVRSRNMKHALVLSRGFEGACMAFAVEAA